MLFPKSNPTLGWLATPRRNRTTVVPPTVAMLATVLYIPATEPQLGLSKLDYPVARLLDGCYLNTLPRQHSYTIQAVS
ncbi:hypothetical protein BV25DRAFT_237116 [Artomyces pyxidatus]|uniref:Uncharacterized protein n=1 Tax=Artomyces pyxidatus TaxID=48021 RepID=A0ACB8T7M6_9AGAM|nr:hypothetical protein BV25DRAFT_237116 [Artomyces pyxidatus]